MKRILIILLTCSLLIPCLMACEKGKKTPDTTQETYRGDDETSPYDADGYLRDDLPADLKYNDEIRILYWQNGELGKGEFDPDEKETETIQRAVYTRNVATEERLDVSLKWVGTNGTGQGQEPQNFVNTVVAAQSGGERDRFDLIAGYSQNMGTLAVQGLVLDLLTSSKYLNLEKPWWPSSVTENLTVSDKLYFASGDISISFLAAIINVFVNKEYCATTNLYDLVYNDEWTLETMLNMVKDQYFDGDGDDKKSHEDRFGVVVPWLSYLDGFFYGSNLITVDHDANGALHVSSGYVGEKADDLCEMLKGLFHQSNDGWLTNEAATVDDFAKGNAMMMVGTGSTILVNDCMKDTSVDYAILPMPKYNENQKDYKTVVLNLFTLWSISAGCNQAQAERAGAVMECLASGGYRTVTPVLYDRCLKTRYAKDGDTGKMYDIIHAGTVLDPGRVFAKAALDSITQEKWQRSVIYDTVWGAQSTVVDAQLQELLDRLCDAFRKNETIN